MGRTTQSARTSRNMFRIVRNFIPVGLVVEDVRNSLSRMEGDVIFNGGENMDMTMHDAIGDGKRRQIFIERSNWSSATTAFIANFKNRLAQEVPRRTPSDLVFLESKEGCLDQPAHSDWPEEILDRLSDDGTFEGLPVGCILALEDDTALNVWTDPKTGDGCSCIQELFCASTTYTPTRVSLNAGDILLFRADLVHSGASYTKNNVRIHCFLDRRGVKRTENDTNYMNHLENVLA